MLDGSILFAIFEVQFWAAQVGQTCAYHTQPSESLLGGGSQSKRKLIQIKTTNQLCISSMGKGSDLSLSFWYSFGNGTGNFIEMYKMQIFQETLNAVMDETGLDSEQILSNGKEEELVDARSVLIKIMNERGLYPIQISRFTGICIRSVNRFLIGFKERCDSRKIMRLNYENIKSKAGLL